MPRQKIQILGQEGIPDQGMLDIPGRLNLHEAHAIAGWFSGRRVCWLVEESAALPDPLSPATQIRLAVVAQETSYYAEVPVVFLQPSD